MDLKVLVEEMVTLYFRLPSYEHRQDVNQAFDIYHANHAQMFPGPVGHCCGCATEDQTEEIKRLKELMLDLKEGDEL